MSKELEVFRKRYQENEKIGDAASDAARTSTPEGMKEYKRLSKQYSTEQQAIYEEMCEAGLYEEWVAMKYGED